MTPDPNIKTLKIITITVILLTAFGVLLMMTGCANASNYTKEDAIKAIIGEAENQGYTGMLAVACAIRNRGTLKGVYGIKSLRVKQHQYTYTTYNNAVKAWSESTYKDITHGATHWENINAFGKPTWANKLKEVFRYKDHVFYKEV